MKLSIILAAVVAVAHAAPFGSLMNTNHDQLEFFPTVLQGKRRLATDDQSTVNTSDQAALVAAYAEIPSTYGQTYQPVFYMPTTSAALHALIARQQAAGIPYYPGVHTYTWPQSPAVVHYPVGAQPMPQPQPQPQPHVPHWNVPQHPQQPIPGLVPGVYGPQPGAHPHQPQPHHPGVFPMGPHPPQGPHPGHQPQPGGPRGPPEIETEAETFPAQPDDGRGGGPVSAGPLPPRFRVHNWGTFVHDDGQQKQEQEPQQQEEEKQEPEPQQQEQDKEEPQQQEQDKEPEPQQQEEQQKQEPEPQQQEQDKEEPQQQEEEPQQQEEQQKEQPPAKGQRKTPPPPSTTTTTTTTTTTPPPPVKGKQTEAPPTKGGVKGQRKTPPPPPPTTTTTTTTTTQAPVKGKQTEAPPAKGGRKTPAPARKTRSTTQAPPPKGHY